MRSLWKGLHGIASCVNRARSLPYESSRVLCSNPSSGLSTKCLRCPTSDLQHNESGFLTCTVLPGLERRLIISNMAIRHLTTVGLHEKPAKEDTSVASDTVEPQRIKFKRPDKTARHIMNILDKEEVEKMKASKDIPDIKPGYIVQLKVEVPENKRRVSILKGIVIARRNAGLHTTFRLRRMVAGVGVESVFPLYSPNIKEMKVLDKKEVRRAKLYYLRDRMNALKQK